MSPREAIQFAREHNARVVDVKFTDLFGMWHHFSMPIEAFTEEIFDEGIGFDGSSHPWLPVHQCVGYAPDARPRDRVYGTRSPKWRPSA
jgi:glutamine synthetase